FGNSIAWADFGNARADKLRFESDIGILHYEAPQPSDSMLEAAGHYPFCYMADEQPDLASVMSPQPQADHDRVIAWSREVVARANGQTLSILK
ncbi:hypothetical protein, partial [Klebsiella sp. 78106]|uniref:hypothetical protein n=1 Tax=Klebsiella sp. 78106 TaxID=3079078 RepID=UPI003007732F